MTERITGIIDRLSDADNYEEVAWLLNAPVENIALSVVDDTMRENAEFQYKAGLPAKVVRYTNDPHACKWCQAQAGTYEYPKVPKDVWRRHERCECIIEYTPAGGGRVDTLRGQGKAWKNQDPEVLAERRKYVGASTKKKNIEVTDKPPKAPAKENAKELPKGTLEQVAPGELKKAGKGTVENKMPAGYGLDKETAVKGVVDELGGNATFGAISSDASVTWNGEKWGFLYGQNTDLVDAVVRGAKGADGMIVDLTEVANPFTDAGFRKVNFDRVQKELINGLSQAGVKQMDIVYVRNGEFVSVQRYVL